LKAELPKTEQSLKKEKKSFLSQLSEARENHLTLQTNETQLKGSSTEALKGLQSYPWRCPFSLTCDLFWNKIATRGAGQQLSNLSRNKFYF
jgi:hypothetical protein